MIHDTENSHISIVLATYKALPSPKHMESLIADSHAAEVRGYYTPDEDERLRETYTRYLAIRKALWDVIQSLPLTARRIHRHPDLASQADWKGFSLGLCCAEMIVRTGEYLIDLARERPIIWHKLDEADKSYDLKRKSFTRLYRQLTSAFLMRGFYKACETYDAHDEKVHAAADVEISQILNNLNLPTVSRGTHLQRYRRFFRHSLKRRRLSATKNIVFSIFDMMGSDIADLKIPLVKPPRAPKRVNSDTIKALKDMLRPGDVFVTRHDDALSNVFLPGFWPHSALWLGAEDADILEAKKDGVLLRDIEETLQVDAFTVLRPKLNNRDLTKALTRARTHVGKLYDFIFDFRTTDRLVCTEVIYRTYNEIGEIDFKLIEQAGRHCLTAEELLNQGISNEWFEVVATYGVADDILHEGEDAKMILRKSFKSRF